MRLQETVKCAVLHITTDQQRACRAHKPQCAGARVGAGGGTEGGAALPDV